jgi:alkaline phosphatase D
MHHYATWDDHDYGKNDGGAEWEGKAAAKTAFMNFFNTPDDSPLRERDGVYDARIFGPKGKRVQVILLDTRWFRGPLERLDKEALKKLREEKGKWQGAYVPAQDSTSTMLGEKQWAWLAHELKKPAELRLIVTSIQAIPVDHGHEKWGNLPKERRRLLATIRDNATGVVLLSGDRHAGDISRLPPETDGGPFFPLYEATASGLNQHGTAKEDNRYRAVDEEPFGDSNFGWIEIDWEKEDPSVKLEIRDTDGKVVREADFTLGELKPCHL